ncbi:MAG: hypothetical protein KGV51_01565 [Moraxellaceae bacterium]|nr:hypothetical protein [Moraxellaceae bacterium]
MQTTQIEVPNEFVPQVRAFLNGLLAKGLKIHSANKQSEKTSNKIKTDDLVNINFFDEKERLQNMDNLLETANTVNQSSLQEMFQLMDKAFATSEIKNEKLTERDWTREELYRV